MPLKEKFAIAAAAVAAIEAAIDAVDENTEAFRNTTESLHKAADALSDQAFAAWQKSAEAVGELEALRKYIDEAPKNAAEIVARGAGQVMTFRHTVGAYDVARLGVDFPDYIRREAGRQLGHEIAEKLPIGFTRFEASSAYCGDRAVYEAAVYVFTRAELEKFAQTAFTAGRCQS